MITTVIGQGEGGFSVDNFFVTAEDPAGPWSIRFPSGSPGIDPDLAWDDDGTCWAHCSLGGRHLPLPDRRPDRRGAGRARADLVRYRLAVPGGAAPGPPG